MAISTGSQALASDINALKVLWVPVNAGTAIGLLTYFPGAALDLDGEYGAVCFKVPGDFTTIVAAEIIVIPTATQGTANWDIKSDYAAVGEAYTTNSETDVASTYNVTANQIFAVDVSGILASLAADDYVGIILQTKDNAHDAHVLGLKLTYT